MNMPPLIESSCETCRKLAQKRYATYGPQFGVEEEEWPRVVSDFWNVVCICPRCQVIIKHIEKKHPDIVAMIALADGSEVQRRWRVKKSRLG